MYGVCGLTLVLCLLDVLCLTCFVCVGVCCFRLGLIVVFVVVMFKALLCLFFCGFSTRVVWLVCLLFCSCLCLLLMSLCVLFLFFFNDCLTHCALSMFWGCLTCCVLCVLCVVVFLVYDCCVKVVWFECWCDCCVCLFSSVRVVSCLIGLFVVCVQTCLVILSFVVGVYFHVLVFRGARLFVLFCFCYYRWFASVFVV